MINLFVIGSLPGIDNWGHIGGLLGGLFFLGRRVAFRYDGP